MVDEQERKRAKDALDRFLKSSGGLKGKAVITMGPTYYTREEAKRLIKWIEDYPLPYFIAEKSTTVPVSYTKEEAIAWVKSRIRE